MASTPPNAPCPRCGRPAPGRSADGLCPACLFAAVAAPTEPGSDDVGTDGPQAVQNPGSAPRPRSKPTPPTVEAVAAAFPQLEILGLIGQGGMGCVFKARQPQLNRAVALKILPESLAADAAFASRFTREAQALAALSHPNIVTIHDFGQAGPFYYLLMEFVDGVNLRQLLASRRLTPEEALAIVPPLCDALEFAHDRGIVHRDIKPENLLLDRSGRIKIADFGIARMLASTTPAATGAPGPAAAPSGALPASPTPPPPFPVTPTVVAGTPGYMAPEQASAPDRVDRRADIYALGVVLYEMLTGELPGSRLHPPSRKVQVDIRLDAIVLRALEHTPELRFGTAAEFRTQLEALSRDGDAGAHLTGTVTTAAPPSPPARLLKTGNALWTTPERLATAAGQLFHYRERGQLVLDDRQLAFSRAGKHTVIPLTAIRSVSLGRYPRAMNPTAPSLLSITYLDGAMERRALFAPMEGLFALPSTWNDRVLEWHNALRSAVREATGAAPAEVPADEAGVPPSAPGVFAFVLIPVMISVGLNALVFRSSVGLTPAGRWGPALFVMGVFLFTWLSIVGFAAWRSQRAARASGRQPARSAARMAAWVTGWVAALGLIGGGVALVLQHAQSIQPVLHRLAWTPVAREGQVIVIDIHTTVGGSGVELRASFTGPSADDWPGLPPAPVRADALALDGGRPAAMLQSGHASGNQAWTILTPGARTWRIAFVFHDETSAIETFRGLAPADLGPVPLIEGQAVEMFHTITSNGRAHVGRLFVGRPLTAADPAWITASARISRSDDAMRIVWDLAASREGLVELQVNTHVHPVRLTPRKGSNLYHADVTAELTRLENQRTRITCGAGTVGTSEEAAATFASLAAAAAAGTTMNAKARRDDVVELIHIPNLRVFFRILAPPSTTAAEASTPPSPALQP